MNFEQEIFLALIHRQACKGNLWADYNSRWLDLVNADQLWTLEF